MAAPTNLLFDQFVAITFLIFLLSLCILSLKSIQAKTNFNNFEKFLVCAFSALLYFSTIEYGVLAVDRSRSLYIFSWVQAERIVVNSGEIEVIRPNFEMNDQSAIQQRIYEQVDRKLMNINGNQVRLTFLGHILTTIASAVAKIFNLKGWYRNLPDN